MQSSRRYKQLMKYSQTHNRERNTMRKGRRRRPQINSQTIGEQATPRKQPQLQHTSHHHRSGQGRKRLGSRLQGHRKLLILPGTIVLRASPKPVQLSGVRRRMRQKREQIPFERGRIWAQDKGRLLPLLLLHHHQGQNSILLPRGPLRPHLPHSQSIPCTPMAGTPKTVGMLDSQA